MKLVNGAKVYVRQNHILDRCMSPLHCGYITVALVVEHRCFDKNCPNFKTIETGSYRVLKKEKARRKEEHKMEKQQKKIKETEKERRIRKTREYLQRLADSSGANLYVIRAVKPRYWKMHVNYVSDNSYADERLYTEYLRNLRESYPGLSIELKHIRNADGSYVTTAEYMKKRVMHMEGIKYDK